MLCIFLSPLPAAHQGTAGLINCFCSYFSCLKSCEMCLLSQRSWGWPRLHHFGSFILEREVVQPVCLFGHFTYFNGSQHPRYRNEWRCHVTFTRVLPPTSPFALLSPPLILRYIDRISLCLFQSFINLLYLLLSPFILSLPFCTDVFPFQVLSLSVFSPFCPLFPSFSIPIPLLQTVLPPATNYVSASATHFSACNGSLRGDQVPPVSAALPLWVGEENLPVLLLPYPGRAGNMEAVTHFLSCPMVCRRIIYPFYWAHNWAEEWEKQTASLFPHPEYPDFLLTLTYVITTIPAIILWSPPERLRLRLWGQSLCRCRDGTLQWQGCAARLRAKAGELWGAVLPGTETGWITQCCSSSPTSTTLVQKFRSYAMPNTSAVKLLPKSR